MLHKNKASELSSEQRIALESLLGRAISDREMISVRAFEPALSSMRLCALPIPATGPIRES
jgi:hypothetical protein